MNQNYSQLFEWDEVKNEQNIQKHYISFEQAQHIFNDIVVELNVESSLELYGERRVQAIGLLAGVEVTVIYTLRGQVRRLISARRAKRYEREIYWQYYPSGND